MGFGLEKKVAGVVLLTAASLSYASLSCAGNPIRDPVVNKSVDPDLKMNHLSIDYRYALPRNSTPIRLTTDCIVLHNTEGWFYDSLRKLWSWKETHIIIDRDGTKYQIVHPDYVAYHAGQSRWKGKEKLENSCIGVEFVDNKTNFLTQQQYVSGEDLLGFLKKSRNLTDDDILGHYQVAFQRLAQNNFQASRGRKNDGRIIDRLLLGLGPAPYDPDIAAGMLPSTPKTNPKYYGQENEVYGTKIANVKITINQKLPVKLVTKKNLRKNLPKR